MEVKYEVNQDLFFTITDSDITGVSTANNNNKEIISILELDNIDKLNVIIDGKKLTIDEKVFLSLIILYGLKNMYFYTSDLYKNSIKSKAFSNSSS